MRFAILVAAAVCASSASAVNVVIDYSYDTTNYFGAGNPSGSAAGQQARAALEAAVGYFSEILVDNLAVIQEPDDYISTAPGGSPVTYSWNMQAQFSHPATGGVVSIQDPVFAADEYRIFVGARPLAGSTIGMGGPGGYSASWGGSYYFQWQLDEINAITDDFSAMIDNRNQEVGDFGSWGGALTFDPNTSWQFDHTAAPTFGLNDFYSVALHEIGHVLGFGTADEWSALTSGGVFLGDEAYQANGGAYPTVTGGHWTSNLRSPVFGVGGTPEETVMDPELQTGSRALWTELDAAGLADIGWEVVPPVVGLPGDFNFDGMVDAADYTVWRDGLGAGYTSSDYHVWRDNYGATSPIIAATTTPEPAALALGALACLAIAARRR